MEMRASRPLDIAEKLDRVENTRLVTEIPTGAPDAPQMTQGAWGEEGFDCHECQRRFPQGRFGENQRERGDSASRKCKTRRSNATRGVILAKPCVGCGGSCRETASAGRRKTRREASVPQSLERADNRIGEGERAGQDNRVQGSQRDATDDGGAGPPGSLAADPRRPRAQEEGDVGSADGTGLPRNAAELQGTPEPVAADAPR